VSKCSNVPYRKQLLDHLIGKGEQLRGNFEAERLSSGQIDDQIELGRRLHRQVCGLLALEDAIDVVGRAAVLVDRILARKRSDRRRPARVPGFFGQSAP
jgi:hypothetical protein